MHFAHYDEAPRSVSEEIIAKVQGRAALPVSNEPGRERFVVDSEFRKWRTGVKRRF